MLCGCWEVLHALHCGAVRCGAVAWSRGNVSEGGKSKSKSPPKANKQKPTHSLDLMIACSEHWHQLAVSLRIAIAIAIAGKETGTRHKKIMRLIDVILMEAQRDPLNLPVSQLHASRSRACKSSRD